MKTLIAIDRFDNRNNRDTKDTDFRRLMIKVICTLSNDIIKRTAYAHAQKPARTHKQVYISITLLLCIKSCLQLPNFVFSILENSSARILFYTLTTLSIPLMSFSAMDINAVWIRERWR